MRAKRRLIGTAALAAAGLLVAACSSSSSSAPASSGATGTASASAAAASSGSSQVTIGVDLTYNNPAFWAAYINYEQQYASQMHIKLLGPLLAAANASLQNQQIENLVNEGAQAIIVNPETATSLGPAISYAAAHHVQLVSVDTIVGAGHVYMVVRASNTLYGQDACAYIANSVKSGYVLDLEGDLTSSNGADRTNAFDSCMAANDPGVKLLKDPTVWTDATAVTDAQDAVNAYGSQLKAIYSQWSSPDTGILPLLKSKGLTNTIVVSDDGVPFEMCDIGNGSGTASPSRTTPPRASSSRPPSPAAARPPCRTSRTTGTPTSPTRSSRRSSPRPPPSCRSRARSTACPPRSRRPRSRTRTCGATCTARPTAASAPHRPRPNVSRWPASSRAPATRTDISNDFQRPGARRGDRHREAFRHHPRPARRQPVDQGRTVPRAGRPQRRGQVDARLDPVRPRRAGRRDRGVRR